MLKELAYFIYLFVIELRTQVICLFEMFPVFQLFFTKFSNYALLFYSLKFSEKSIRTYGNVS